MKHNCGAKRVLRLVIWYSRSIFTFLSDVQIKQCIELEGEREININQISEK
jgi:hypothetical protein